MLMTQKKKQPGHLVRLNQSVHAQLKAVCKAQGRTMSFMANWIIARHIAHKHPELTDLLEPEEGLDFPSKGLNDK